ncbi:hypothetical protein [Nocardioides sp.]
MRNTYHRWQHDSRLERLLARLLRGRQPAHATRVDLVHGPRIDFRQPYD